MSADGRRQVMELSWRLHRWIYQASDGRIGSSFFGTKVLELTTKGRRSGKQRAIMIFYFPYQEGFVIVGSNSGSDWPR